MAVNDSIKMDNNGWYLHSDGDKLTLRYYRSDTDFDELGDFYSLEEALRGYVDRKQGRYVEANREASLQTVLANKRSIVSTLQSSYFSSNPVRIRKVVLAKAGG